MEHQIYLVSLHYHFFDTMVVPSVLYGAEIWSLRMNDHDAIDKTQRFFIKQLLGLPTSASNSGIFLITNKSKCDDPRYWRKIIELTFIRFGSLGAGHQ